MSRRFSRRDFLAALGSTAMASSRVCGLTSVMAPLAPLYPAMDLSYFKTPIKAAPARIHFGYAAITWAGNDRQAIEDIAAVGFRGIQLRANAIEEFGSAGALHELLGKHQLTLVALSSGNLSIDPAVESEEIDKHSRHARFVHDAGGLYLQIIDQRPKGRAVTAADYQRLGRLLTEIGKRSADLGVTTGYHNHMGTLGERPEEVDRILAAADPRYVKLLLDIAHYRQGGGDPAKAIEKYHDRLLFLHFKDVHPAPSGGSRQYQFVELGRGEVDVAAVMDALKRVKFRGWAVVELDSVPDKSKSPRDYAVLNKKYLEEKLGVRV